MNGRDWSTLPDVLARGPDGSRCNLRPISSKAGGGGVHTFQHVPPLPGDHSWKCYTDPDVWAGSKHVKALIIKHPTDWDHPEQSYHYTGMSVWTRENTHTDHLSIMIQYTAATPNPNTHKNMLTLLYSMQTWIKSKKRSVYFFSLCHVWWYFIWWNCTHIVQYLPTLWLKNKVNAQKNNVLVPGVVLNPYHILFFPNVINNYDKKIWWLWSIIGNEICFRHPIICKLNLQLLEQSRNKAHLNLMSLHDCR